MVGKGSPFGQKVEPGSFLEPAKRPKKFFTTGRDHEVSSSNFILEEGGGGRCHILGDGNSSTSSTKVAGTSPIMSHEERAS